MQRAWFPLRYAALIGVLVAGGLIGISDRCTLTRRVDTNHNRARCQMANLATAVRLFLADRRRLPSNLDALHETAPEVGEACWNGPLPLDPWGSPFRLRVQDPASRRFEIVSSGRDGLPDTRDDHVWAPTPR